MELYSPIFNISPVLVIDPTTEPACPVISPTMAFVTVRFSRIPTLVIAGWAAPVTVAAVPSVFWFNIGKLDVESNVLFSKVSSPALVANVPVVGKVTFVDPVAVSIIGKFPAVVKVLAKVRSVTVAAFPVMLPSIVFVTVRFPRVPTLVMLG